MSRTNDVRTAPTELERRAKRNGTSMGIDWNHEYAVAHFLAEKAYDQRRRKVPKEKWISIKKRYVKADVLREVYHTKRRRKHGLRRRSLDEAMAVEPESEEMNAIQRVLSQRAVQVEHCLQFLSKRQRSVMQRLLAGRRTSEIAKELGISKPYAWDIRASALRRLHRVMQERRLIPGRPYTTREML